MLKTLWGENLGMNTVHIYDVCKAITYAANEYLPIGTYNLSDLGNTN